MKPETAILKDLRAGQSTADSLAPRVGLQTPAAAAILRRLEKEGKVLSSPLMHLRVWRLSHDSLAELCEK